MLPRAARLPYNEFRLRGYRAQSTPFFVLKVKKGPSAENRIGIIIGNAAVKSATRRNFWKRRAKAVFMSLPAAQNDYLIIFSGGIKKCTAEKFRETFLRAAEMVH